MGLQFISALMSIPPFWGAAMATPGPDGRLAGGAVRAARQGRHSCGGLPRVKGKSDHVLILLLPGRSGREEAELQPQSARQTLSKHLQTGLLTHGIVSPPSEAVLVLFQVTDLKKKRGQPRRGFL